RIASPAQRAKAPSFPDILRRFDERLQMRGFAIDCAPCPNDDGREQAARGRERETVMQSPFSAAIADRPIQPFQWLVIGAALIVLVIEGIDLQSLPIVTPLVLEEWGIDRAVFGPALAAALFGMAFGSSLGGWLGDRWGRLRALYLA